MSEIYSEIHTFSFQENALENVVCKMAEILFRPLCVKGNVKSSNATVEARNRYICVCVSILIVIEDTGMCIYHASYQQNRKQAFP